MSPPGGGQATRHTAGLQCVTHKLRVTTHTGTLRKAVAVECCGEDVTAQAAWQRLFPVAQAVLWVVDATDIKRVQGVQDAMDRCANCGHGAPR